MTLRVLSVVALLLALGPHPVPAQDRAGVLTGRVDDEVLGHPVAGAMVAVAGTALSATTDSAGRFVLVGVPVGVHRVLVRAIGYQPVTRSNVVIGSGKPFTLVVGLRPLPVRLEALQAESFFERPAGFATSTQSVEGEEIRRAPGVQEDVLRSVQLLPGVAVTSAGRNDLIVRGGAPFENLFLVDDLEVPNLNHFGSQGSTGGPLSLINIDFVRSATFSAGGFGPRYGDRTASVTRVRLRDGNNERLAGEVNLSATGFGVIAEGPVGSSSRMLVGARRSYLDLLFKAAGFSFVPAYWDVQFKSTTDLGPRDQVTLVGLGAINTVSFTNETADDRFDNSRILAPEQRQYIVGLTWRHLFAAGRLGVTLGRTYTRFDATQTDSLDPPVPVFRNRSTEGENTLRVDFVTRLGPSVEVNVGSATRWASRLRYDLVLDGRYRLDGLGQPRPLLLDTALTAFRSALYANVGTFLGPLRLDVGARASYYAFLRDLVRIAPRVSGRLQIAPQTLVSASAGRYHQAPSYIWLVGDPGNPTTLEPIVADQFVLGIERLLRPDLKLQVEGYVKWYRRYPARRFRPQAVLAPSGFEDVTTDIPFGLEPLASLGSGRAYGIELVAQKRLSEIPVYGLLSLTAARSVFTGLDGVSRAGAYDARVIGNLVAGYRPSPAWEFSGRFRVASGLPTTPFVAAGPDAGRLDFRRYNGGPRLPTFHAVDLRVDRRWSFQRVQLEIYVDVQNVYGRANVDRFEWNPRGGLVEAEQSLGVLPTLGVNLEF